MNTIDLNLGLPPDLKDNALPITWKISHATGNTLYVGKIRVANYWYNALRPQGNIFHYRAVSNIEGIVMIKDTITETEAAEVCHQTVRKFLKLLNTKL